MELLKNYLAAAKENLEKYRAIEDPVERERAVRVGENMVARLEAQIASLS